MKKSVSTTRAPAAIGPYSQAVLAGNFLYVSGQLPVDPASGKIPDSIKAQAQASLNNIDAILAEAGFSRKDVVKTTIFLKDLGDFAAVNEVYGGFFEGAAFPARSTVEISRLPKDASIEIEAVACKD
jgi:2-iminobutanoate/2-iminopropanoate deaminase